MAASARPSALDGSVWGDPMIPELFLQDMMANHTIHQTHIDSYNAMLRLFCDIVNENGTRTATHYGMMRELRLELTSPHIERPQFMEPTGVVRKVLPRECRERGLFYESPLMVMATLKDFRLEALTPEDPEWKEGGPEKQYRRVLQSRPQLLTCALPTSIPTMVGGENCHLRNEFGQWGECPRDLGGYFIVGGYEREVQILKNPRPSNPVIVTSKDPKYELECEIRSGHPTRCRNTSTMKVFLTSDRPVRVVVRIPYIDIAMSVPVVLKLVGFETADRVRAVLFPEGRAPPGTFAAQIQEIAERDLKDPLFLLPRTEMMRKIGELSGEPSMTAVSFSYHQQSTEFLPQCGYSDAANPDLVHLSKATVLRQVVRRIIATHLDPDRFPLDSRDHLSNKYFQLCHVSLSIMFRQLFADYMDALRKRLYTAITRNIRSINLNREVHRDSLFKALHTAFTKGDITVRKAKSDTTSSVIQLVPGTNWLSYVGHAGRTNLPTNRDGKSSALRLFNSSSWPYDDASFTPEGADVGLIGSLSIGTRIRIASPPATVLPALERLDALFGDGDGTLYQPLASLEQLCTLGTRGVLVYVDGNVVGLTTAARRLQFVDAAREARRKQWIPIDASVTNRIDGVHVDVCDGIPIFPAIRVSEVSRIRTEIIPLLRFTNKGLLSLCLEYGIAEYLSPEEILEFRVVSTEKEYRDSLGDPFPATHIFPHPQASMSLSTALIPFPNYDQGPRITYQNNMGSQAISETFTNTSQRWDALTYWMWYTQTPLAITDTERVVGRRALGLNLITALGDHRGMTAEDSIVVARGSIERGIGRMTVFRTFTESIRSTATEKEELGNPAEARDPPCMNMQLGNNYSKIGVDGLPIPGTQIQRGDVLIGKWISIAVMRDTGRPETARYDRSFVYNYPDSAVVDKVRLSTGGDGRTLISVCVRFVRQPHVGDKMSSRHGQKGTIGLIVNDEDMPVVMEGNMAGCRPDIVIPPQSLGRMTIGQLLEVTGGQWGAMTGQLLNATPFQGIKVEVVVQHLRDLGMSAKVKMMDGRTGTMFDGLWNVGPVLYQFLRHMVADKVRARVTGPNTALTRQPTEGKKQDGGLRIGGMETDVLKGHGAADALMERLRDASDRYVIRVCRNCGSLCDHQNLRLVDAIRLLESPNVTTESVTAGSSISCRLCGSEDIVRVTSRYATRLLIEELATIGIKVELHVENQSRVSD